MLTFDVDVGSLVGSMTMTTMTNIQRQLSALGLRGFINKYILTTLQIQFPIPDRNAPTQS